jgi:iron(III) transport system permease protein
MVQARSKLTYSLILIVGSLTLCPVVMLVLGSFSKGLTAFGSFTLDKYIQAYTDPAFFEVIANTIVFVLGSSTLATGLALFPPISITGPIFPSSSCSRSSRSSR